MNASSDHDLISGASEANVIFVADDTAAGGAGFNNTTSAAAAAASDVYFITPHPDPALAECASMVLQRDLEVRSAYKHLPSSRVPVVFLCSVCAHYRVVHLTADLVGLSFIWFFHPTLPISTCRSSATAISKSTKPSLLLMSSPACACQAPPPSRELRRAYITPQSAELGVYKVSQWLLHLCFVAITVRSSG